MLICEQYPISNKQTIYKADANMCQVGVKSETYYPYISNRLVCAAYSDLKCQSQFNWRTTILQKKFMEIYSRVNFWFTTIFYFLFKSEQM